MNTLNVKVTSFDLPLSAALVRLSGDAGSLAGHPDAVLALADAITWTREVSDYNGNRWNCWQKHVVQDVAGITWQEFREQVLTHNPSLRDTGGMFEAGRLYFLPENCLPANTAPLVGWDRELTGFGGQPLGMLAAAGARQGHRAELGSVRGAVPRSQPRVWQAQQSAAGRGQLRAAANAGRRHLLPGGVHRRRRDLPLGSHGCRRVSPIRGG